MSSLSKVRRVLALGACALLVSCGGSDPTGLKVTLTVDGVPVSTLLLAGGSSDVELASGGRIELTSNVPMDVRTSAGAAVTVVEVDEAQRHRVRLTAPGGTEAALVVVSEVRGSESVSLRVRVAPQRFDNRPRVVGETVEYAVRREYTDGSPTFTGTTTETVRTVQADGRYTRSHPVNGPYEWAELKFDGDGNLLQYDEVYGNFDAGIEDSRNRTYYVPCICLRDFPMYVGQAVSGTHTSPNNPGTPPVATESLVEAYETITVPAGSFATLRFSYKFQGSPREHVCWWSVDEQVDVKCVEKDFSMPGRILDSIRTREAVRIVR